MLSQHAHPVWWQARSLPRADFGAYPSLSRLLYPACKRLLDITAAIVMLVALAPLMLVIALAIKLESPGPVLHVQRRTGLHGRVFRFYKFRSMTNGHDHTQELRKFAEAYINGQQAQSPEPAPAIYKPPTNGHSITRVGRWLRRTSLDELPQLINVLKGDMSLVGPRPHIECEVNMYTDRHRQRLAVPPGLTGWAQINGRSSLRFEDMVRLDLEYIAQRSLRKDLAILLATVPAVLQARDAG